MPLTLKFSIQEAQTSKFLIIKDETGIYNATTNTGGYGAPNDSINDATNATLAITYPGAAAATTITVYPTLPNLIGFPYIVTNVALGLAATAKIPDGIAAVTYSVVFGAVTRTVTCDLLFTSQARCCIDGLTATVKVTDCACDTTEIDRNSRLWYLLEAAELAAGCNKPTKATTILNFVKRICAEDATDCKTC